ncbi:MAG: hypothetical protein JO246_07755 [Frankiaceae bacterium]|nr:hypothetical protein [Frankiaceae bacterium]MBV9870935.1 hypothetical protein [Frankiaceae bacterium]
MADAAAFAPDQDTIAYGMEVLPQRLMTPGMVGTLIGPGNAGPEMAGALSLVYASFADAERAQHGFRAFTDAQRSMLDAPGFLRWITFADGPHGFGLGWWRSADDAIAWSRGEAHRRYVADQRATGFELSQYAGIFTTHTVGARRYYCPRCGESSVADVSACPCGESLDDGFAPSPTPNDVTSLPL